MADYGVTSAGFIRKPYNVVLEENEVKARELFGEDVDLTVYSPVGLFVKLLSWQSNILWQELENAYYANWLDTAEGINLDRVVKLGGLLREGPQYAVIEDMVFQGTAGTVIPQDFIVETNENYTYNGSPIQFKTTYSDQIKESGSVTIRCIALVAGASGLVPKESVTEIPGQINPKPAGLDSVINLGASIGARDAETDIELRSRYKEEALENRGSGVEALKTALMNVDDVISALVFENIEITYDDDGRPPKSVECIVYGGSDQEVAEAIFNTKSAGIESYGETKAVVLDSEEKEYDIYFSRARVADVCVVLDLTVNDDWDSASITQMKSNIISYIGGIDTQENTDGESETIEYDGLDIGDDIYPWKIIASNKEIEGIVDVSVYIGASTSGYQDIKLTGTNIDPEGEPTITAGTYHLNVGVDGADSQEIDIVVNSGDTWKNIIASINQGLRDSDIDGAVASIYDDPSNDAIRITSYSAGEDSIVSISDGTSDGFIDALDDNYTPSIETAVYGTIASGFQEILLKDQGTSEEIILDPEDVPGFSAGTYDFNLAVDGGSAGTISFDIASGDTWEDIVDAIDAELTGARAEITSGIEGRIRITSLKVGTTSAIAITDGTTLPFLAAIDGLTDIDYEIFDPLTGEPHNNIIDLTENKLNLGNRKLPRCGNYLININTTTE